MSEAEYSFKKQLMPALPDEFNYESESFIMQSVTLSSRIQVTGLLIIQDTLKFPPNPFTPTWSLSKKFAMSTIPTWSEAILC